jgi:tRNA (adenine37-N6)-methyltransferase
MEIVLAPIGFVRGGRVEPDDDGWDAEICAIELDRVRLDDEAVTGLEAFSHVEVVYQFHLVAEEDVTFGARHPRGRTDWPKVGILAQRGRVRPNRLGVTVCALLTVEPGRLVVRGLDAIDGTPVLDVKPFLKGFAPRSDVVEPEWAHEIMASYW